MDSAVDIKNIVKTLNIKQGNKIYNPNSGNLNLNLNKMKTKRRSNCMTQYFQLGENLATN